MLQRLLQTPQHSHLSDAHEEDVADALRGAQGAHAPAPSPVASVTKLPPAHTTVSGTAAMAGPPRPAPVSWSHGLSET